MDDANDAVARKRRARIFERHEKAALDGIHLPSNEELLRGMPFYSGFFKRDIQEFANRVMARLKAQKAGDSLLAGAIGILSVSWEDIDLLRARDCFERHSSTPRTEDFLTAGKFRCEYYAACLGHTESMLNVATYAISAASNLVTPYEVAHDFRLAALGWLDLAARPFRRRLNHHPEVIAQGQGLLDHMIEEHERQSKLLIASVTEETEPSARPAAPEQDAKNDNAAAAKSVIVIEAIGNADVNQGSQVRREFSEITGKALPLRPIPDLAKTREILVRQYPHLEGLIYRVLMNLAGEEHVRLRPLLFVGPAGCGKTSFAQRLLQVLGIPSEVFPCGGLSDSSLMGTARRWASGEPSLPLGLIRRFRVASPGIILDEIEKAGQSRYNGSLHDCLLGLLEPQSASVWRDPYLQSAVDLSHVIWLATANSPEGIPRTLLDRMTCIEFPVPNETHLEQLANNLLMEMIRHRRLDSRWFQPVTPEELASLRSAWTGGSMRQLQRLVDVVYRTREDWSRRH
jgi:hypothetical protein